MRSVLEDFVSDDVTDFLRSGSIDSRFNPEIFNCSELVLGFDDVYDCVCSGIVTRAPEIAFEAAHLMKTIRTHGYAMIDDGSEHEANRAHFFALYERHSLEKSPPPPPPRGPRWRSDAEIARSREWIDLQAYARRLLELLGTVK